MNKNSTHPNGTYSNLVALLRWRALHQPQQRAYTFLVDGETEEIHLTYEELDRQARAIAAKLQNLGMAGERVLLLHTPGLEYATTFLGCLYAGAVAVPTYPPRFKRPDPRLQAIVKNSQPTVVFTDAAILSTMERRLANMPELAALQWLDSSSIATESAEAWREPEINDDTLAFLQYTSGSTGTPKGVMVSHGNLLHNLNLIYERFEITSDSRGMIWLPPYHDMGLIGGILSPPHGGIPVILMSPMAFLQKPVRWLTAISRHKVTISGGPNFAYDFCSHKVTPEQKERLDLSHWALAFSGAEPIRAETIERFAATFKSCGFRREAFYPCYGLAEATVFVSGGLKTAPPVMCRVASEALEKNRTIRATKPQDNKTLVGCGQTGADQKIVIVNPKSLTRSVPGQVGEIWVSGPSVARGYWDRADESAQTFQAYLSDTAEGPFLRTGDLGFLRDDKLFITGRLKDLIIIRGRNHYPQDIELTVERSHPALRPGCGATFGIEVEGEERLVVVQEVERTHRRKLNVDQVASAIRQGVLEQHQLDVYAVVFLKTGHIPKTSSGKIRRRACRAGFLDGSLAVVGAWRQDLTAGASPLSPDQADQNVVEPPKLKTAEVIQNWLVTKIARQQKVPPEQIDIRQSFTAYGLDSTVAVSLSGELEDWLARRLSPTLIYDYPTIETLAQYLANGAQSDRVISITPPDQRAKADAIAIIGLGCRFPGANNLDAFWQLLRNGEDAITQVPPQRWPVDTFYDPRPGRPGKMNTRWGGFLAQVDQFDPQFFGISPREAARMDPQHRLLLEVSWEALEHAGLAPNELVGSQSGVFIGISSNEYGHLQFDDLVNIDAYTGIGNAFSIAANRLSYLLDLRGPSLAIDTACSSSLVAVHLACQSLAQRACNLALVGGVNLILSPNLTITFSHAQMMAADGRCKTFAADADGYVRGEGCGVVVLKRLSDALAQGDNILAIIRGSAINQDGRSNGLTAPNGPAQQAVIRQALRQAGVEPGLISYVETHGTGTPLGDPIEMNALKEVLLAGRDPSHPCSIGSVKTNIGHLEAAAGIAGLLKVVLSLQHGEIPPHLHLNSLNPHISIAGLPLLIPTKCQQWPKGERPRLAGVSSFGFGGTNAHVVLEEGQEIIPPSNPIERPHHILTLSTKGEQALQELAGRFAEHLASPSKAATPDICFTANTGRAPFTHRLALVAKSRAQLQAQVAAFLAEKDMPGIISGQVTAQAKPKVAFLFTGQGSHYIGMGRQLYDTQPTFRRTLDQCAEILRPYLDQPLLTILYPDQAASEPTRPQSKIDQTVYTQPALFALEYGLAKLWMSWGIKPEIVLGHSVGEYVAACLAGVFSLEDGLKLITERGRLMQALPEDGQMMVVFSSEEAVMAAIEPYTQEVSIAAINGPRNIVVSGSSRGVEAIVTLLQAAGIKTRKLPVSHPFHSPLMEPMLNDFKRVAERVTYSFPKIDLISNLSGEPVTAEITTPAYWCHHIRQPVRFAAGMETLGRQGVSVFVEIGPKPTLLGMGRHCLPKDGGIWLPSLRQGQEDWRQMLQSLAELFVRGVPVDWVGFDQDYPRRRVTLPTYPFQRQRYWIEREETRLQKTPLSQTGGRNKGHHPLLGRRLSTALKEILFESQISQDRSAYLAHHHVFERPTLPITAYLEMALAAGSDIFKTDHLTIEAFDIQRALILPENKAKPLQLILTPEEDPKKFSFQIFSLNPTDDEEGPIWIGHASGKVLLRDQDQIFPQDGLATLQAKQTEEVSVEDYYRQFIDRGIEYGPSFQGIEQLWSGEGEALGRIRLPEQLGLEAENYKLHPALLDAAFQVLGAAFPGQNKRGTYMYVGLERLHIYRPPGSCLWSHASIKKANQSDLGGDVRLFTPNGEVVAEVKGLQVRPVSRKALLGLSQERLQDWLYEVEWRPLARFGGLPDYLSPPSEISAHLRPQFAVLISQPELAAYGDVLNQLEVLSVAYVGQALTEMGWQFRLRQRFSTTAMADQLGVVSSHLPLLGRLLEMLAEVGVLQPVDSQWEVCKKPEWPKAQEQLSLILAQHPAAVAELTLLERCGAELAAVLRGQCDPLQLLFPAGDLTTATQLYQDSPGAQVMNTLVQEAILSALAHLPETRGVHVLEIGGGTGGTTAYILPHLTAHQTEYVFTDVGPHFVTQAQEKFQDYSFVRYQTLDIEREPLSQGFDVHQYDLVLAANVLHATRDLSQTLAHVQQLLAPGGILILLEGTTPQRWMDLIFGLTEGWWRFADHALRPNYPLLSTDKWQKLLLERGFERAEIIGYGQENQEGLSQQALIVAQMPQIEAPEVTSEARNWLIMADNQGLGRQLATHLRAEGAVCTLAFPGQAYEQLAEFEFRLNPANPIDFEQLLATMTANRSPLHKVVHLWSLAAAEAETLTLSDLEAASLFGCGSALHLIQALLKAELPASPSVWLVTRDAQPAGARPPLSGIAQSPLWGMGKVIALEHPDLWGGMIDLPPEASKEEAAALLAEIKEPDEEDLVAFRVGGRYVPRLVRSSRPELPRSPFQMDGTYLITGGLGGLGLKVAQWLVGQGAQHLVLVGRSAPSEATKEVISHLSQAGIQILVTQADVSRVEEMGRVFEQISPAWPPLRGIVHAAGVARYQAIRALDFKALQTVFRPKVMGTWTLHQLTKEKKLDFLVSFSSMVSVWGAKKQGDYVAANHFLDTFAHYRRSIGLSALSVNWGPFSSGGLLSAEALVSLAQMGVAALSPEQVVEALGYLLGVDCTQITVAKIDWPIYRRLYETRGERPLLKEIAVPSPETIKRQRGRPSKILQRLTAATPNERPSLLIAHLQAEVAKVLGLEPPQLPDRERGFFEMGMDSLMAVELKRRLEVDFDTTLSTTLAFDFPTIKHLADYLVGEVLRWELGETNNTDLTKAEDEPNEVLRGLEQLVEDKIEASITQKLAKLETLLRST